jgi:hypothetical protein
LDQTQAAHAPATTQIDLKNGLAAVYENSKLTVGRRTVEVRLSILIACGTAVEGAVAIDHSLSVPVSQPQSLDLSKPHAMSSASRTSAHRVSGK